MSLSSLGPQREKKPDKIANLDISKTSPPTKKRHPRDPSLLERKEKKAKDTEN